MKKILFVLVLSSLFVLFVNGQNSDSLMKPKISVAKKMLVSGGFKKAYELYSECASQGNAESMNALGIMYQRGWGVAKNEVQSIIWFEKAVACGYGRANANLVQVYAKGLGVNQDFERAVYYTKQMLNIDPQWANSKLGYFYYKGLGVEQNYEEAIKHFQIAASKGSANAYYFLGLCYRNGFGVARNEGEAQYYLQKANEMGHYYSSQELNEEVPETEIFHKRLNSRRMTTDSTSSVKNKPYKFRPNFSKDIFGEFEGTLTTYDYSGKYRVSEVPLVVRINNSNHSNIITGDWIESDTVIAKFEASLTDSTLRFLNTSYSRTDYYNKKQAVKWNFTKANLEKVIIDNSMSLTGNIQMFSPQTKEPQKPMYISLKQATKHTEDVNLKVIPTLGNNDICISFELGKKTSGDIEVYTLNGCMITSEHLGLLEAGSHKYVLALSIPRGIYLVRLNTETSQTTKVITKN